MIPEEPPLSATVTTAVKSAFKLRKLFKITGNPVPPPMTVILGRRPLITLIVLVLIFMNVELTPYAA